MSSYLYEIASRLIALDTVSSKSNAEAMEYLGAHLDDRGFRVSLQRTEVAGVPKVNLIACAGPAEPDGLIISGHVDTVPFIGQPGWERDPLRLEIDDTRVYGRGTSDMKVFLAQCVDAAARLNLTTLKRPLVFLFTADEEVGCLGAARMLPVLPEILGEIPPPHLAWIGEPTSYQVFHTHKGIGLFTVTVRGRGGHSSVPEQGVNAIAVAGKVIETIGRYQAELRAQRSAAFAELFPESPYTTLNFGSISGGTAANMIAEECTLQISYRPLPQTDPLDAYREIARRLQEIDTRDYGSPDQRAAIELSEPFVIPPLLSPRETPLESVLFAILDRHTSGGAPFATDGCQFALAGIASLICGPGDLEQAHQPNESIRREAFENGAGVILAVVHKLCGGDVRR
ncbi:MAG: acetylornithine deacetylase [Deltaproteobacteria bacterium]|nr:acetylornithine deacetylase [Deltaproteobacteria bacterium]